MDVTDHLFDHETDAAEAENLKWLYDHLDAHSRKNRPDVTPGKGP